MARSRSPLVKYPSARIMRTSAASFFSLAKCSTKPGVLAHCIITAQSPLAHSCTSASAAATDWFPSGPLASAPPSMACEASTICFVYFLSAAMHRSATALHAAFGQRAYAETQDKNSAPNRKIDLRMGLNAPIFPEYLDCH